MKLLTHDRVWCPLSQTGEPLRWRKSCVVRLDGDVFEDFGYGELDTVFGVMAICRHLTFQILTKRPDRASQFLNRDQVLSRRHDSVRAINRKGGMTWCKGCTPWAVMDEDAALPNVWLGTSCEDQAAADERIPHLLRCPAAVRFLSCEPLIGEVDLNSVKGGTQWIGGQRGCAGTHRGIGTPECPKEPHHHHDERCGPGIDWVIVGGESGKGARPCDVAWIRSIVEQCREAGVPCFVKRLGARPYWIDHEAKRCGGAVVIDVHAFAFGGWEHEGPRMFKDRKGGDPGEWPEDLRVREMPVAVEGSRQ